MAQKITLTVDDYLYIEALGSSAGLGIGERSPFIGICSSYVEHQDQTRFIDEITTEFGFEDREALELAEALRNNVINLPAQPGESGDFDDELNASAASPKLGVMPNSPVQHPAQQGQVRIPAQQQRPAMPPMPATAPKMNTIQQPAPMPPQPARELPKIPVGFTAFGPLNLKQQGTGNAAAQSQPTQTAQMVPATPPQPQKTGTPQISVFSQKNISAPSPAVFPSNQGVMPEDKADAPPTKTYEKGKDPYRETF